MGSRREGVQGYTWVKRSLCTGDFMLEERAKGGLCWLAECGSMLVSK